MPTFDKIPAMETKFKSDLRGSAGIYFNEVTSIYPSGIGLRPKKGSNGTQYESYYFPEEKSKKKIVLHSTVGFLTGDVSSLAKQDIHMSVQYLIARDGTVYEFFDPKYWSYHLGKGAVGGNSVCSKESIGIELSNIGPLTLKGATLYNVYGSPYCNLTDINQYKHLPNGFRGYEYFATFTDAQYISLNSLISFLCNEFNIPRNFLSEDKRVNVFSSTIESRNYSGICTHVNFRATGKYDLGPDFEWERITSDSSPIVVDPDKEFIYTDDVPVTNPLDPNFGKVPKTAAEKAKESNNSNSSHYCSLQLSDQLDETYEGGVIGNLITQKLNNIEWENITITDSSLLRKTATDAIAEAIYDYVTSADSQGNPVYYSVTGSTTGSYITTSTPPVTVPVGAASLQFKPISWPSLNVLKDSLNKYFTGITDLFTSIFTNWFGEVEAIPTNDDPQIYFQGGEPGVQGEWLTGTFKFKCDPVLLLSQAVGCESELQIVKPSKLIETWSIIQKWFFNVLTLAISGEQNGTGIYTPGPSIGSAIGGGASSGYCLGVPSQKYTASLSTCLLTFMNPIV